MRSTYNLITTNPFTIEWHNVSRVYRDAVKVGDTRVKNRGNSLCVGPYSNSRRLNLHRECNGNCSWCYLREQSYRISDRCSIYPDLVAIHELPSRCRDTNLFLSSLGDGGEDIGKRIHGLEYPRYLEMMGSELNSNIHVLTQSKRLSMIDTFTKWDTPRVVFGVTLVSDIMDSWYPRNVASNDTKVYALNQYRYRKSLQLIVHEPIKQCTDELLDIVSSIEDKDIYISIHLLRLGTQGYSVCKDQCSKMEFDIDTPYHHEYSGEHGASMTKYICDRLVDIGYTNIGLCSMRKDIVKLVLDWEVIEPDESIILDKLLSIEK